MTGRIVVTGAAGFIGWAASSRLLSLGYDVLGIDNMNDYYDVRLKNRRLDELRSNPMFSFVELDICDEEELQRTIRDFAPNVILHLAAQAGVRYSIENPGAYVRSNLVGFLNVLEVCRALNASGHFSHLVYASSSSVYGNSEGVPYSVDHKTDSPVSLYAATKKADELMAYAYSSAYQIHAIGLRFFTVYGPMGRPDMAYFKFTDMLVAGEPIPLFNNGDMWRDFTFIDDIVDGVIEAVSAAPRDELTVVPHRVYNLGNSAPELLTDFIDILESLLIAKGLISKPGARDLLPMQIGEVYKTFADIESSRVDLHFEPKTSVREGLSHFVDWYATYRN